MNHLYMDLPLEISAEEAKLFLAIKLYELGKISAGKAAEMSNYSKGTFLELASKYKVATFNYGEDDLEKEMDVWKS